MSLSRDELKGLFRQLVTAAHGVVPAAAALGITHQYVSRLQVMGNTDYPDLVDHIAPLEEFVGQPIVTGAIAKMSAPNGASGDPMKEAVEVAEAGMRIVRLVHDGAPVAAVQRAVHQLKDEADDVPQAMGAA